LSDAFRIAYCTNVHPGLNVTQILENIERFASPIRLRLIAQQSWQPSEMLGLGLWVSDEASQELLQEGAIARLKSSLEGHQLLPFTMNGFPQGNFHQRQVKHRVYLPTWWQPERLQYTQRLVRILDELLPPGELGSISTLPIAWGSPSPTDEQLQQAARHLMMLADDSARLEQETGRRIVLAIEPEPGCVFTDLASARRFFERWLLSSSKAQSLSRYLTICYDICHSAVMGEDQAKEIQALRDLGMKIGKVQVSSAVEVDWSGLQPRQRVEAFETLTRFAEDRYLHQTTVFEDDHSEHELHEDLPPLLKSVDEPAKLQGRWRVHFHVPIFHAEEGMLKTTRGDIKACLKALKIGQGSTSDEHTDWKQFFTGHFEVETYAWNVLPRTFQGESLVEDIASELEYFQTLLSDELEKEPTG
jgi:hypothetical protein